MSDCDISKIGEMDERMRETEPPEKGLVDSFMPLMLPYGELNNYPDAPKSVPFAMLDEKMAYTVHSQTLKRLSERGGLCPSEMLSLMTGQNIFRGSVGGVPLYKMDNNFAISEINKILSVPKPDINGE